MRTTMRYAAAALLGAAAAGSLITATAGGTTTASGTLTIPAAAPAASALAPISITLSGLDGHGTPTSSIQTLPTTATAPKTAAGAPKQATQQKTTQQKADPGPEGISVIPAEGAPASSGLHAHATAAEFTTLANGLDLVGNGASTFTVGTPGNGGMRYVYANFKVRYAHNCGTPGSCAAYTTAAHNLTLFGAETANTIQQTAIAKMSLFDGTAANPNIAPTVIPTDGVAGDGNLATTAVYPEPGLESLQVFTEAQLRSIAPAATVTSLLPYAYVVKNLTNPTTRALPANPVAGEYDGGFTIALAFPTQTTATQNPFSISLVYQPVDDTKTRVTQSLEDDNQFGDSTTAARTALLGSTDEAVLGNNHVTATNVGDPICSVRTAGTAAAPTAYLVRDAYGPNLASLPYNATSLSPTGPINAAFCQSIATPGSYYSQYVVSGSQSGLRTAGGHYDGTYAGGGTNTFSFTPGRAFFTGERVNLTVANATTGVNGAPQGFVGISTVGGATPSTGEFESYDNTSGQLFTGGSPTPVVASTLADFDGDGDQDLAILHAADVNVVFGDGRGGFGVADTEINAPSGASATAIAAPDLNGDGHADLVFADGNDNEISVALSTGSHRFTTTPTLVSVGTDPDAIAFGDFNGDGHTDVAVANQVSNNVTVLFGDGTGAFPTSTTIADPAGVTGPQALVAGDFNGDGHTDLAVATTSNQVFTALSNGSGGFTTTTPLATGNDPAAITAGDFDGDGHLDVATANSGGDSVTVGWGSSSGTLGSIATVSLGTGAGPAAIVAEKLVTSGRTDLLVLENGNDTLNRIINGGGRNFGLGASYATGNDPVALDGGDLDNDNRPDAVVLTSSDDSFAAYLGQGDGTLTPAKTPAANLIAAPGESFRPAVGDFNGDGNLDYAVPGIDIDTGHGELTIDLGDGHGGVLSSHTIDLGTSVEPQDVQVADFNGDGIPDLAVTGGVDKNVLILKGDGTGNFTTVLTQTLGNEVVQGVVGDFNGDGKMDYATMTLGSPSSPGSLSVWLNTGNFTFSVTNTVENFDQDNSLDVADLNGDGNLDLVVTSTYLSAFAEYLPGLGNGTFGSPVNLVTGGSDSFFSQVTTGDFNGDGIPDIAFADLNNHLLYVLTARRGGGYNTQTLPTGSGPFEVLAGDVNGDGVSDLVVVNSSVDQLSTYLGSASGVRAVPQTVNLPYAPQYFTLGDVYGTHQLAAVVSTDGKEIVVPQL